MTISSIITLKRINSVRNLLKISALTILGVGMTTGAAQAITITSTTDAKTIVDAITAGNKGIIVTDFSLTAQENDFGAVSSGTYTNQAGTYGIGNGIVFSTGDVADYETGSNTDIGNTTGYEVVAPAEEQEILFPISGISTHFDYTRLDISFDIAEDFENQLFFNVAWGSEEFDEFVGSSFIDAFGLYVNGENIAFVDGKPVNIDHPDMKFLDGTELDGLLAPGGTPLLTFSKTEGIKSTGNTLTFILADSGDDALDSTVYISGLGAEEPEEPEHIPEPTSMFGLMALAYFGAGSYLKRKQQ